jgi:alkanesulfonate monooxygenase SsuD/methylene tetrahydromethanopterin reductase-like flavin-dependent oxidoreductase (luciferase family)
MHIEFGVWDHFENRPGIAPSRQYGEKIELVQEAERLGFAAYHVAEHHLSPLDMAPSPAVFLPALAQATNRIRLGAAVFCLPLYHPLRLLQELCMLDNISEGRLDVGVGRGIRTAEHNWFGLSQDEARGRFDEVLAVLLQGMSEGRLSFHGRYYDLDGLTLDLLPLQRPYPPLWYAGGYEVAGRDGYNYLGRDTGDVQRYWQRREAAGEAASRVNPGRAPKAGFTRRLVIREDYEEAIAIARRAWPVFEQHWYATPVLVSEDGRSASLPGAGDFEAALRDENRLLAATPEMLRQRIVAWQRELRERDGFYFAPAVQWGDVSLEEAVESLRLIAKVRQALDLEPAPA